MVIGPEATGDEAAIDSAVVPAYETVPYGDHTEKVMIRRLRGSTAYVPRLDLVPAI